MSYKEIFDGNTRKEEEEKKPLKIVSQGCNRIYFLKKIRMNSEMEGGMGDEKSWILRIREDAVMGKPNQNE